MDNTPIDDALALRAAADAFDAQRGKLPVLKDPHRSPDPIGVARQISALGKLITELGDEVLFRVAQQRPAPHTGQVMTDFAAAIEPAGEAAAAMGMVAQMLAHLDQTEPVRDQPHAGSARQAAARMIAGAITTADLVLHGAANSLNAAATAIDPASLLARAARSRSTISVPASAPLAGLSTALDAPSVRGVRSR